MASEGGIGFLNATKARRAEGAMRRSEALITVLRLGEIDLTVPEALVAGARRAFESRNYSHAIAAAKSAERIALILEDGYNTYAKALEELRARREEIDRFGIPVDGIDAAVKKAEARIAVGVWDEGIEIPDYTSARAIVEKAEREGKELVEKAAMASNAVFMAELAIEALVTVPGPKDRDVFEKGGADALESALEGATRRLALRDYDQATRVAKDLEARANRLRAQFIEATETLAATSAVLGELRDRGVSTGRLGSQLAIARDVLHRGVIDPAAGMARRLFEDARTLGDGHTKASTGIADATNRYSVLVREGHLSASADRAILDARRAVRDARYPDALRHLEDANAAITHAEADRESLARSLVDRRSRITVPANPAPFLSEATEILGRAEKEFKEGNYSGSSEDLVLATLLLGSVTPRAGARRVDASAGNS
jgi:hypothetical protein